MSNYFVTFRIADQTINGQSYDERRQSIIDSVWEENHGYWEETTSFLIVSSSLDTETFATVAASGLSPKHDMLVAFDPEDMSVAYFGAIEHPDVLATFFRTAKKLP